MRRADFVSTRRQPEGAALFNLRATAKLLRRLKCAPAAAGEATTRLGDWYGNLFSVGRQQFAMFTSERSLLSVVLPAKEIHPLPTALTERLHRLLSDLGVPRALIDDELAQMQPCIITATASRSVLGSMNDFTFAAKIYLGASPPLSLAEIHLRLAETPMKPLGYRYPREVALDLLSGANSAA
jgi:hypothetical protein